jgi:hypothetical protein
LEIGILIPNNTLAHKIAMCPFHFSFILINKGQNLCQNATKNRCRNQIGTKILLKLS